MHQILKASIALVALTAFAAGPLVIVLNPDVAYANNGNGGGGNGGGSDKGGGSGGNGGSDKGNSGGSDKGNSGSKDKSSAGKSSSSKSTATATATATKSNKASGSATKSSPKKSAASKSKASNVAKAKAPTKTTSNTSIKPMPKPQAKVFDAMHPNNLGKLNGAINSSVNAKLAHIRNGNFNGPVGMAAALALADYNYGVESDAYTSATQTLELAAAFDLIAGAPTEAELADANALIGGEGVVRPTEAELLDAKSLIEMADENTDAEQRNSATQTLELAAAFELIDGAPTEVEIADANALIGGVDRPTEEQLLAAQAAADAGEPTKDGVTDAEAALLASYKGTLNEEANTKILDAVRASLPTPEQIAEATRVEETVEEPILAEDAIILIEDTAAISE